MAENTKTTKETLDQPSQFEDSLESRASFATAPSPSEQYSDLRSSLAQQVQGTRQNLSSLLVETPGSAGIRQLPDDDEKTPMAPRSSRATMGWEARESMASETGEDGDDLDDTMGDDDAALLEEYKTYAAELKRLLFAERAKVLEERNKNRTLEEKLRKELCDEFTDIRESAQKRYDEIRETELQRTEDLFDERLKAHVKMLNEEWKAKRDEHKAQIEELTEENEKKLAEKIEEHRKETKECNELKDKLSLELEQLKTEAELLRDENNVLKAQVLRLSSASSVEPKPTDARDAHYDELLAEKDNEIKVLNEMLEEAGQTFQDQQLEITQLTQQVNATQNTTRPESESPSPPSSHLKAQLEQSHLALEEAVSKSTERFKQGEAQIEQLREQMTTKDVELEKLKQQVNELQEKLSDDGDGLKLIELESKIFELEQQLTVIRAENERLNAEAGGFREQKLSLEQSISELKSENVQRRGELEAQLQDALRKVENKEAEIKTAQEGHATLERQFKDLRDQSDLIRAECELAKEANTKSQAQLNLVKEEKGKLEDSLKALEKEKAEEQSKADQFEKEIDSLKLKIESALQSVDQKQKALQTTGAELTDVKTERDQAKKKLSKAVKLMAEKDKSTEMTEQKASELENANAKLRESATKLQQQLKDGESEIERIRSELDDKNRRYDQVAQELKSNKDRTCELDVSLTSVERRVVESEARVAAKHQEINSLTAQLNTVKNQMNDVESDRVQLRRAKLELEAQLSHLTDERTKLQQSLDTIRQTLDCERVETDKLRTEISTQCRKIAEYRSAIKETEEVQQKFETVLGNKDKELQTSAKDVENLSRKLAEQETTLNLLRNEMKRLENDLQIKSAVESQLRVSNESLQVQNSRVEEELKTAASRIEVLETEKRTAARLSHTQLELQNTSLKEQLAKEASQNALAIKSLNEGRQVMQEKIRQLESEKSNLRELNEHFKQVKLESDQNTEVDKPSSSAATQTIPKDETVISETLQIVKDEVEVSPAVNKPPRPPAANRRNRRKDDSVSQDSEETGPRTRRRQRKQAFEREPSPEIHISVPKRSADTKKPRTNKKSNRAAHASSPDQSESKSSFGDIQEDAIEEPMIFSADRPTRRAKTVAEDGIQACGYANSIRKLVGSVGKGKLETQGESSPSDEVIPDARMPPKKRTATKRLFRPDHNKLEFTPDDKVGSDDDQDPVKSVVKSLKKRK